MKFATLAEVNTEALEKCIGKEKLMFLPRSLKKAFKEKSFFKRRYGLDIFKSLFKSNKHFNIIVKKIAYARKTENSLIYNPLVLIIYKFIRIYRVKIKYEYYIFKLRENQITNVIIYNGDRGSAAILKLAALTLGIDIIYMEGGFFPNTFQVDKDGICGNISLPQNSDFYKSLKIDFSKLEYPSHVNKRVSCITNKMQDSKEILPKDYFFVPMQVPSDMQITELSPWIKNMKQFYGVILQVVESNQDMVFLVKEHPNFKKHIQKYIKPHNNIKFVNDVDTEKLIEGSKGVIAINSTVGVEAVSKGVPVYQLGISYYGIDGLVKKCSNAEELKNALKTGYNLDEELREKYIKFLYNIFLIKNDAYLLENICKRAIQQDKYSKLLKD